MKKWKEIEVIRDRDESKLQDSHAFPGSAIATHADTRWIVFHHTQEANTYFKHKSTQKMSKRDIMRIYKRGNMLCDANWQMRQKNLIFMDLN